MHFTQGSLKDLNVALARVGHICHVSVDALDAAGNEVFATGSSRIVSKPTGRKLWGNNLRRLRGQLVRNEIEGAVKVKMRFRVHWPHINNDEVIAEAEGDL